MNTSPLFEMMRKTQEAYRVRHGLPVERQYTDDELVESMYGLDDAERILNRRMSDEERLGRLSPDEQRLLDEMNRKNLPFHVTVTTEKGVEKVSILAPNAVAANVQAVEMLFGEFDTDKPEAFKLKVEPVRVPAMKRAA